MDWWEWLATEYLWRNAVAVVPLAVLAAVVCRWVPCNSVRDSPAFFGSATGHSELRYLLHRHLTCALMYFRYK